MKYILFTLMANSINSIWMKHPISLGTILMIQSLTSSLFTILMTKNSWYSMILFITFSSGLMIMFMYMSSISSNEKFKWSFKILIFILMNLFMLFLFKLDKLILFKQNWMEQEIFLSENEEKKSICKNLSTNKIFMFYTITTLILLTLISISNLINSFEGPLKLTYVNKIK
uniref:NADH dehydrogenase subunit 6 n=1 Tax=Ishiharodelphax matsuyamensis TaxID=871437 RepID=A0A7S5DBL6_9HEMI|nr:NADH dehydrogenase subunit 6 [Ishiharodelphax matsuyamensis]QBZ38027.1 NADH dehydrogenase subunit 6 [Ishiharodelphax matsuyamensis]